MIQPDTVVLVHGLWVHGVLMTFLRRQIGRGGYHVQSYSYPTLRLTLSANADRLAHFCHGLNATQLHFVGHSMGGLVILKMLESARKFETGRIVLAGTPFAGSHAAHRMARLPGGRAALGRSMPEWLGNPRPGGLERYEIGVIAGSLGLGLGRLIAPDLPLPNDGVVTVDETRVPSARDHIVLRVSHTAMLFSNAVALQVRAFLKNGAFLREQ